MDWLLDGNVLVALRLDSHTQHHRAHRWFNSLGSDRFATCSVTQGTLLRLHMKFASVSTAAAAWMALREVCEHSSHVYWNRSLDYRDVPHRHLQGSRQVTDAWMAELARLERGKLATMDESLAALHDDVAVLVPF